MPTDSPVRVAVDCRCQLGEGPVWHPERGTLLWVDIYDQVVCEADGTGGAWRTIGFGEPVSALGLIDASSVAVASAAGLYRLNLDTGERALFAPLEADKPGNRSNDGRVGPGGAFWIGTMADRPTAEGKGAVYRYHAGAFDVVRPNVTTPNSIAFSPDGTRAYFSDTGEHRIWLYALDPATGAPRGKPELFVDLSGEGLLPDGSVVDSAGRLWNAQFGSGRVACYRPDGTFERAIDFPVAQTTCPAFGGSDFKTLFVTSASVGLDAEQRQTQPLAGAVFAVELDVAGQPERRLKLGVS